MRRDITDGIGSGNAKRGAYRTLINDRVDQPVLDVVLGDNVNLEVRPLG